jgi:GNAT superfamily N-acetyltransferase
MGKGQSCRKAVKSDLSAILRLYAQPEMDNGKTLSLSRAEEVFERIQGYPNYHLFVALDKDKIVGTFALLIMDNLGHQGAPSAIIEDVVVDPAYQGQGIGKRMMQYAFEIAKEEGCYKAVLSSDQKRKKAHHFYESLGFERHGYSFRLSLT